MNSLRLRETCGKSMKSILHPAKPRRIAHGRDLRQGGSHAKIGELLFFFASGFAGAGGT